MLHCLIKAARRVETFAALHGGPHHRNVCGGWNFIYHRFNDAAIYCKWLHFLQYYYITSL